ncbi:beta-glucosidase 12-like [Coffea arabica]|uniref:Beta-glucosidase 12-like n=1 Tax=Coffea arabica TaxID=13443 RepID=A0A6P6SIN7_COFAR|nr:beta-glucosidase 12-like [Coffea arabica]
MEFLGHILLVLLVIFHVHGANAFAREVSARVRGLHKIDRGVAPLSPSFGIDVLNRSSFPKGFVFGVATSAYQVEGAWNIDGKGPSNWDIFTHKFPGKIANGSNGDVATDSYHRYKNDIKLLKEMNGDSYRFSIAWSRVIPDGNFSKGINEKGIQYYNKLIDELLANGLTPTVTIFHWDVPQALEEEYGGFLSPKIVKDYHDFANLCFERFGDRVKHWITLNEPWTFSTIGYDSGTFAPGRCSAWKNNNCTSGNSGTEPYLVAHHQLLAHADVVKLYKTNYQAHQKGKIGITLVSDWFVPFSNSALDQRAAIRALDFMFGWFMNPLVYGDYPPSMRILVGNRLPKFRPQQSKKLIGSYDFLGLNYYTANYAVHLASPPNKVNVSYSTDGQVNVTASRNGQLIGVQAGSDWLHVYPKGLWDLLIYIKRKYKNPIIYITENGVDEKDNQTLTLKQALKDNFRIQYYYRHLQFLRKAISNGVRVKGYYGWSLIDNFEWSDAYSVRFGINYVDYKTLQRFRKLSSYWFERFLRK